MNFVLFFIVIVISYFLLRVVLLRIFMVAEEFVGLPPDGVQYSYDFDYNLCLFRQNTYLQNKKHTLTCQVGLVVTDLITSPVVSWEGWETPPPPPAPRLSCHSLLNHRRGKTSLLLL